MALILIRKIITRTVDCIRMITRKYELFKYDEWLINSDLFASFYSTNFETCIQAVIEDVAIS